MNWIESRLGAIDDRLRTIWRILLDLQAQLRAVQQGLVALAQQGGAGSGESGGAGYYGAILSAALAAGSGGVPAALASQTVWQLSGGARGNMTGTFTVYNDTGASIASGSQVLLASNPDGSFTVISVACTGNT